MTFSIATLNQLNDIFILVQKTIKEIYPNFYNNEVVDFFIEHHSKDNIKKDILDKKVYNLFVENNMVGTGCYKENIITRVYVDPDHQNKGYGTYIIKELENIIIKNSKEIYLDASLPAIKLYEKLGYKTVEHKSIPLINNKLLVYEIMSKRINKPFGKINYNNKVFYSLSNTNNGEVNSETIFHYFHDEDIIWANYAGGFIAKGYLVGTCDLEGNLDFYYQHININNKIKLGKCHSIPVVLENGKIELHEAWQWLIDDKSSGKSIIIEK